MISELKIFSAVLLLAMISLTGCRTATVDSGNQASSVPSAPSKKSKPLVEQPAFQPSFQPPAGKRAFDYAYTIYRSSPAAPTGVFTYLGIVYVIVNIDTMKVKARFPKGPAMLKAKKMLEARYPLPAQYSLNSRQIESRNYRKQKIFRYVLAYRESDILDCCRNAGK